MLAIRMQRTGRKGHAMFRVIVQESRLTPTSGKVVARLGSYDPHAKTVTLDKEKATFYLDHGAQPSPRVVRLLKSQSVKLPDWVKEPTGKQRPVRNPDKRRSTRPAEATPPEPVPQTPEATAEPEPTTEAPTPETSAEPAENSEAPVEQTAEAPAAEAPEVEASTDSTETTNEEPAAEEPAPQAEATPANTATDTEETTKPTDEAPAETPASEEAHEKPKKA